MTVTIKGDSKVAVDIYDALVAWRSLGLPHLGLHLCGKASRGNSPSRFSQTRFGRAVPCFRGLLGLIAFNLLAGFYHPRCRLKSVGFWY